MATKLKNMKYTSADLVKRGANQHAHIMLMKSANEKKGGAEKMNQFEKAVQILKSMGFKITKGTEPTAGGMNAVNSALAGSCAVFESLVSIIQDQGISAIEKSAMITETMEEFSSYVESNVEKWSNSDGVIEKGTFSEDQIASFEIMKTFMDEIIKADIDDEIDLELDDVDDDDLDDEIDSDGDNAEIIAEIKRRRKEKKQKQEKGMDFMKKSEIEKMDKADRAAVEEIAKKYGLTIETEKQEPGKQPTALEKAVQEVEALKKSMEMQEMTMIAKKYESIGKKADETAAMLYDLKKADENAYNQIIKTYDEMVTIQESSNVFKEYGSSYAPVSGDLSGIVAELRKTHPDASQAELIVKAYEMNPNMDQNSGKLK